MQLRWLCLRDENLPYSQSTRYFDRPDNDYQDASKLIVAIDGLSRGLVDPMRQGLGANRAGQDLNNTPTIPPHLDTI